MKDLILLTPKILENNGFKLISPNKWYFELGAPYKYLTRHLIIKYNSNEYQVFIKYDANKQSMLLRIIKYVYELQEILYFHGEEWNIKI